MLVIEPWSQIDAVLKTLRDDVRLHQPKSLFTHVFQLLTFQQTNERSDT